MLYQSMKLKNIPCLFLFLFLLLFAPETYSQVSITSAITYSDLLTASLGAAAPANWTCTGTGTRGGSFNLTSQTTGTSGGWYGNGNLSFLGSGTASNGNATWQLQNNTGATITSFVLSYDAFLFKSGTASPTVTVSWTNNASVAIPTSGILTSISSFNDASSTLTGTNYSFTIPCAIPSGDYIYIRFLHSGGANSDNLGWDNINFTPSIACVTPVVTVPPSNTSVCEGATANFTTTVTGNSLIYKWQEDTGSGFVNINDGGIYSGSSTSTLALSGVTLGMSTYAYRCYITNSCGNTTSSSSSLTVTASPATPTTPTTTGANPTCNANSLNTLTPLSGQTWYWQGTTASGTSSSSPTSSTYPISSTGTYYVRAQDNTSMCWSAASASVSVTINTAPIVTTPPANSTGSVGMSTSFNVIATGGGLTYQWQENQGSGWVSLTDNAVYAGSTTASLTVSNLTLAMSGWQYQCVITGTCSPSATSSSATLTVVTYVTGDYQSIASGNWSINTSWAKWNGVAWVACVSGDYPNLGTANVEIMNTHAIVINGTGPYSCKNIVVHTGGTVWVGAFGVANKYLQIYGNITCDGNIGVSTGDDISFRIAGGITCTISGTGSFYAARIQKATSLNPTLNSTLTINMNIFLFWSSSSGTVLYNNASNSYFDVIVSAGKTLKGITTGAISNNIAIDGVLGTDLNESGGSITVFGNIEIDGTLYATTNNTVRTCSIIIKNGGTIKCAYVTASASGTANSVLTIESGGKLILTATDAVSNPWSNFSTTGNIYNFNSGSTVEYAGIVIQNIESHLTYSNITFSGGGDKFLNGFTNVNGIATFINGIVYASPYTMNMSTASSAIGANNLSFVSGQVVKTGSTNFTFPVGKVAEYRPIAISALTGSETFNAEYFYTSANPSYDLTLKDASIDHLSYCEYWILNRIGTQSATVSLSWNTYSCGVDTLSTLTVARWDGSMWRDQGNGGTTGNTTMGTVISNGLVTSFSPFTLGSTTLGSNPLPIELLSFSAQYNVHDKVDLKWTTTSESNNDFFTIERSSDAIVFEELAKVDGAGNSNQVMNYATNDASPLPGTSYYRLKQTDFNGTFKYSAIQAVQKNNAFNFDVLSTYSSPENGLEVNYTCTANARLIFELVDITGKTVYSETISSSSTYEKITLPTNYLSKGIYLLKINGGDKMITKKILN